MKILSPQLGLAPKSVLGGEVFDREVLLGLAKKDIRIEIILPSGKKYGKNIKNWQIHTSPIAHAPAFFYNFIFLPQIYSIIRKNEVKIIRLHAPKFIGLGCLILKKMNPKLKLLATYHQMNESSFGPFSKLVNTSWDHIICDSNNVKVQLTSKYQISPNKITVVHNGVPKYLRPQPKNRSLIKKLDLEGKFIMLYMGFFIPRKNPLFLLEVMNLLLQKKVPVVLLFLGSGPFKERIITRATELGINSQIRIIDPIFGEEKTKIHNIADLFVHPSIDEGFALAPLEAMACSKVVIMNRSHSASEAITNGKNGYLSKVNDVKDWSQKIIKLYRQENLRKKMGRQALKRVNEEFSWKVVTARHIEVLNKL